MPAFEALSPTQFNTERSIIAQGNPDELTQKVRGVQNLTSNVYKPSFSADYRSVQSTRSPASAQAMEGEEEDE